LGVALDAPAPPHRPEAPPRDREGIETAAIDRRRDHADALPRYAMARTDRPADLALRPNTPAPPPHTPVVEALERILSPEALVPRGEERDAARACRRKRAPRRGASMRMHDVAAALPQQRAQARGVARHHDRVAARGVEPDQLAPGLGQSRL